MLESWISILLDWLGIGLVPFGILIIIIILLIKD